MIILLIKIFINVLKNIFVFIDRCRSIQDKMFDVMNTLIRKTDLMLNLIRNSESVINDTNKTDTSLLPDFPLSTLDEFKKFEEDVARDRNIREQFVSIFFND